MSIANLIGTITVAGVISGVIGYFGYHSLKSLYNKYKQRKEIPRARTFINQLNARFPPGKLSPKQREEREKAIIDSGFSRYSITVAQTSQPSEVELIIEWFQKAIEINGMTIEQAESLLIDHGWNQKSINKAKKKLFKLNKGGFQNARKTKPKVPSFPEETASQGTGIDSGTRSGIGNGKIEHKRILPVSSSQSIERDKRKSQWNWKSFKQDG